MGLQGFARFQIKMVGFGEVDGLIGQGERARLVNHDGINLAHALQGGGIFDEHLQFGSLTDAHHERRRCGQSHGTRAGNDQHSDGRKDGLWKMIHAARNEPDDEGEQGDGRNNGHKHERHLVNDALHRRFAALGGLHHADDLCQSGVFANLLCLQPQLALTGDGACQHPTPHALFGRSRLARNHALVDIGRIGGHKTLGLRHDAVDWYLLACADL